MRKEKIFKPVLTLLSVFILAGVALNASCLKKIGENDLGLRKTDLYTETNTVASKTSYTEAAPGESKTSSRSFENAPPQIPHSVEGMLPITSGNNQCLTCHLPEVAKSLGTKSVPETHYYDMRRHLKLAEVSNSRFGCTQCHVPQSDTPLAVDNTFRADFRNQGSSSKSSLMNILNEGAR